MQTVKEYIRKYFNQNLSSLEQNYPGIKLKRLLEDYCQFHQIKGTDIYQGSIDTDTFIKKVEDGVPLEYILKETYFYKSSFYVDSNVLIPRSETEILVEDSIQFLEKCSKVTPRVCEIGVGSFVIGLTIAMESSKDLDIIGGDICPKALEVGNINLFRHAKKISKGKKITLTESNKFENIKNEFDLIVTNPPYIKKIKDKEGVHFQANKYEPHIALYLADDSYDEWFLELFENSYNCLMSDGAFLMEGHEDNLENLKTLAEKFFSKVEIKNDYTDRKRFLYAYK